VLDPVACDVESNPNAIYGHAARQAAAAAEHIRRCAHGDPSGAADAAWAAADTLHVAARVLRARRCGARRTPTTAPPVRRTAASRTEPAMVISCALRRG